MIADSSAGSEPRLWKETLPGETVDRLVSSSISRSVAADHRRELTLAASAPATVPRPTMPAVRRSHAGMSQLLTGGHWKIAPAL
jgi:hypothetical protein